MGHHVFHVSLELLKALIPGGLVILSCSAPALRHKEWRPHTPSLIGPHYPPVAIDIHIASDSVLRSMDRTITLTEVMAEEEVPDASDGALKIFNTCGLVLIVEGRGRSFGNDICYCVVSVVQPLSCLTRWEFEYLFQGGGPIFDTRGMDRPRLVMLPSSEFHHFRASPRKHMRGSD